MRGIAAVGIVVVIVVTPVVAGCGHGDDAAQHRCIGHFAFSAIPVQGRATEVTVPARAAETDVIDAYDVLHQLGLRVGITEQIGVGSLALGTVTLAPPAGTRVPRGSTIEITPHLGPVGSPAVLKSEPHCTVPDFTGESLSQAVGWADGHDMYWAVPKLPPLDPSTAPHLFDAYRVVGQDPKPGDVLGQGVKSGAGYRPTPLTLTVVRSVRA
jgi:hypothetical protein